MKLPTLVALLAAFAWSAFANDYEILKEQSIFAVVTHRGGPAAAMAHNHIVYPTEYTVEATNADDTPENAKFTIRFATTSLTSDTVDAQTKWFPYIQAAGILNEPFKEVSEKDRAKIRESMLSEKQLDAAKYPEITAKLIGLKASPSTQGKTAFTHVARMSFTVHGRTVERDVPAHVTKDGDYSNHVGMLEPVGTDPAFRRQGFGREVLQEGLRRLKSLGATRAYVTSNDPFYIEIGFEPRYRSLPWEKDFK